MRQALSELTTFEDIIQNGRVAYGDVGIWNSEVQAQGRSISTRWMGGDSISSGSPHVLRAHMGVHRTCGEPDETKKKTHPKKITALLRDQVHDIWGPVTQPIGQQEKR